MDMQVEQRQQTVLKALKKDRLHETYESPEVRKLKERLELLENGRSMEASADPHEQAERVEKLRARLQAAREGQENDLASDNPKVPVVLVKPTDELKTQLSRIERTAIAAQAERIYTEESEGIRAALQRTARTQILMDGLATSPDAVRLACKEHFVDMLMQLEGKTDTQLEAVSPYDPELELTEEEERRLRISEALEGAELAVALLTQDQNRTELIEQKRTALIQTRKEEAEKRRELLMELETDELIEQVTQVEVLNRTLEEARKEVADYWLLFCVLDGDQPLTSTVRRKTFLKGYAPFFADIQEVRDVKEGMEDFHQWLMLQKNRLDFLSEEDLYAISAYEPFRPIVRALLGARGGTDEIAAIFGQGVD